ncbi:MAG: ATP-binding cassette domain-containing protein [Lachnospiraceae bacterium]
MSAIIEVENIKKRYGKIDAVKGINFYVEQGKLFSFLGPNGAGKSTTIDILCTLLKPDSGNVLIDGLTLGKEDKAIRNQIGVVFQDSVLDPLLTVRENLSVRARFYDLAGNRLKTAVENAAVTADVTEFIDRPYGRLSGGQRRRADIARALINTPKILFLDEPTTGLDPKTKKGVWKTISALQKRTGMTVFLTTHYMEEAAKSDYIIILNHGEIAVKGTPYDLKEKYSSDTLRIKPKDRVQVLNKLNNMSLEYKEKNGLIVVKLKHSVDAIPILVEEQVHLDSFEVIHGSMDDVFLNITGGELKND